MRKVKTLVHKGAMPIAVESVRTFSKVASGVEIFEVHSDGSLEEADWKCLEQAGADLPFLRVEPIDRREKIDQLATEFPAVGRLLGGRGYMTKLQVLAVEADPFFYFDSDILWLKPFEFVPPPDGRAVFSTETWSWYFGMQKPMRWVKAGIPRRVNSGFAWIVPPFPIARLEMMLREELYTPDHLYSTDQEILAFLFPDSFAFALSDFGRTRVGVHYDLASLSQVAMHFPGGMWKPHLEAIRRLEPRQERRRVELIVPGRLDFREIFRMKLALACEQNFVLQRVGNVYRRLRNIWKR
jgi:hypothetical protein